MRHLRKRNLFACVALVCALSSAGALDVRPGSAADELATSAKVMAFMIEAPFDATIGFTRTTIAPGGSYTLSAGSGPALRYVEQGTLFVQGADDSLTLLPATEPGDSLVLSAGSEFLLDAGETLSLSNTSSDPVVVLDLLSADDAIALERVDVSQQVLEQHLIPLGFGVISVALTRAVLAPGAQLDWPQPPAITVLYPIEPADSVLFTGQGIDRGAHPVTVYALTITPIHSEVAPPVSPTL